MLKVFLVEDETVIREGLRDKIPWDQYGYRFVGEASDGEMALPLIRKTRPDLIITDIKMPFMDGFTMGKHLMRTHPGVKLIIFSGFDEFQYAKEAIKLNVVEYILKPVNAQELTQIFTRVRESLDAVSYTHLTLPTNSLV